MSHENNVKYMYIHSIDQYLLGNRTMAAKSNFFLHGMCNIEKLGATKRDRESITLTSVSTATFCVYTWGQG